MTPANVLGLGWACTPAGLKAMEELAKLEAERGNPAYLPLAGNGKAKNRSLKNAASFGNGRKEIVYGSSAPDISDIESRRQGKRERIASNEMCTFLILNISSLQLIPVNMIAYRQQYGSVSPAGIIAPAILATAVSTAVAVVYCKMKDGGRKR